MPRQQDTSVASLIHHYAHVACALNETRKGSPFDADVDPQGATAALEHTIKGVCQLIDQLVAIEHKDATEANARTSS